MTIESNIFEQASRKKLRFVTPLGVLTAEDLWDLPLVSNKVSLDSIAKTVNRRLKDEGEESFVETNTKVASDVQLMLDILKHVIAVRKAENEARVKAADKAARKQQILGIIGDKETLDLQGRSLDELRALLNE